MYTQNRLFDPDLGAALRDEAIARVEAAAPVNFLDAARNAVRRLAQSRAPFTTDDVWRDLPETVRPPEPRALGAVMREMSRDGVIVATDSYRPSARPVCHRNPKRLWVGAS